MNIVLFIVPFPSKIAPSQRFRLEQYFIPMKKADILIETQSFYNNSAWNALYDHKKKYIFLFWLFWGFFRRFYILFTIPKYNFVFIHREASPIGPPIFEWIIAKIFRKKIIYDFDDAVWMQQEGYESKLKNFLKNPSKVNAIIKWSYKVSCGNNYLCKHAKKFNNNVILNPTTIDTVNLHNQIKNQSSEKIAIGWTGTHSTLMYLEPIVPVIRRLEKEFNFDFIVICNKNPKYTLKSFVFIEWKKDSEINDLLKFNFGLMPLIADKWTEGKCGFKALQYMALGMPAIISPVGVNKEIVSNGIDGYLCQSEEEWYEAIKKLLLNESIRTEMGKKAREKIINYYSVQSNTENFLNLFS